MSAELNGNPTVVRTSRGLTVGGTRLTLYQLMDHFKAGHTDELVQEWYSLTPEQVADIHRYIAEHENEVEAEYEAVLKSAEAERQYWQERNRERFEQIARQPLTPEQQAVRKKIEELRARAGRS
jgi:uncharacterized protein (DUF433 family)